MADAAQLTVCCVLRSGGPEYRPEHVVALAHGVQKHLSISYRFVCLTDIPDSLPSVLIDTIRLQHNWPGWWSKIELFNRFKGQTFYLDLDTVVVDDIENLVLDHRFTVLENFWSPSRIGSGLMAWNMDLSEIYHRFRADPSGFMREYRTLERWGDQGFIKYHTPVELDLWQTKFPNKIVSYRKDVEPLGRVPDEAAIVCFGGKCRPWNVAMKVAA